MTRYNEDLPELNLLITRKFRKKKDPLSKVDL